MSSGNTLPDNPNLDRVLDFKERILASKFDSRFIKREDLIRQYITIDRIIQNFNSGHNTLMLADDVGMGKTYVALGVLANYLFSNISDNKNVNSKKYLIVTPGSKILQNKWAQEIRSFYENAGVKSDVKNKVKMNPVIIDSLESLLKLSIDVKSYDRSNKRVHEGSPEQMLFSYILYEWAKNRKLKVPSSYLNFGPLHILGRKKEILHYYKAFNEV